MPTLPCPNCHAPTSRAMEMSQQMHVNYYRCEGCKHIWTTDKETHALIRHVTPLLPSKPNDSRN